MLNITDKASVLLFFSPREALLNIQGFFRWGGAIFSVIYFPYLIKVSLISGVIYFLSFLSGVNKSGVSWKAKMLPC